MLFRSTYVENGASVLEHDCDILIPAAMEGQITVDNAERIMAPLIAEAANGPVTFNAHNILMARGKVILPDAFLNAGGVVVSYLEWVKNLSHIRFGRLENRLEEMRGTTILEIIEHTTGKKVPPHLAARLVSGVSEIALVRSGLDDTMRQAYNEIREIYNSHDNVHDLRTAAYVCAIEKIYRSYVEMGV